MRKLLTVFDGYRMSKSTMEYAILLTKAIDAHLVGTYKKYDAAMKELDQDKRDDAVLHFQKARGTYSL